MSSDALAIRADSLTKSYQIYAKPEDRLKQSLFRNRRKFFEDFVALNEVSFDIKKGETVGIVGRNGSGKSTLLQIIAGTLTPTSGQVECFGRVAALLELGAGFNPEFSGRENAVLNASIMGLSPEEVEEAFPRIVEFSEIGDFIDRPVKTYSSGMYVRLAFAVAINVSPEILIVDEALSVGDEAFQRKCFAKIHKFQEDGGTILFVSHAPNSVIELCNRAFLMHGGGLILADKPKSVVGFYQRLLYDTGSDQAAILDQISARSDALAEEAIADTNARSDAEPSGIDEKSVEVNDDQIAYYDPGLISKSRAEYGSVGATIHEPHIETLKGARVNVLKRGERYAYCFRVTFDNPFEQVRFGMFVRTTTGLDLGGSASFKPSQNLSNVDGGQTAVIRFEFDCLLLPGAYFLNAGSSAMIDGARTFLHRITDALMFRVMPETDTAADGIVDFRITANVSVEEKGAGS